MIDSTRLIETAGRLGGAVLVLAVLASPRILEAQEEIREREQSAATELERYDRNLEQTRRAIEGADVVMALRIQRERQQAAHLPTVREYSRLYGITAERLRRASGDVVVMVGTRKGGFILSSDRSRRECSHPHRTTAPRCKLSRRPITATANRRCDTAGSIDQIVVAKHHRTRAVISATSGPCASHFRPRLSSSNHAPSPAKAK